MYTSIYCDNAIVIMTNTYCLTNADAIWSRKQRTAKVGEYHIFSGGNNKAHKR